MGIFDAVALGFGCHSAGKGESVASPQYFPQRPATMSQPRAGSRSNLVIFSAILQFAQ
jgi:hypothetical protein